MAPVQSASDATAAAAAGGLRGKSRRLGLLAAAMFGRMEGDDLRTGPT